MNIGKCSLYMFVLMENEYVVCTFEAMECCQRQEGKVS
jgi:hypothetical protein